MIRMKRVYEPVEPKDGTRIKDEEHNNAEAPRDYLESKL